MKSNPTDEFYQLFMAIYDHFNKSLFENQLRRPLITIIRKTNVFGYYSHNRWQKSNNEFADEIAINPLLFVNNPLVEIFQTVVHEMCHQWQYYHGHISRNGYHNQEWADKMQNIGLMPSSTGKEGGKITGQSMADYIIKGAKFDLSAVELMGTPIFTDLYYDLYSTLNEQNNALDEDNDKEEVTGQADENLEHPKLNLNVKEVKEKKQKIKYSCDICDINVWGKPDLKLVCGECRSKFIMITPNQI